MSQHVLSLQWTPLFFIWTSKTPWALQGEEGCWLCPELLVGRLGVTWSWYVLAQLRGWACVACILEVCAGSIVCGAWHLWDSGIGLLSPALPSVGTRIQCASWWQFPWTLWVYHPSGCPWDMANHFQFMACCLSPKEWLFLVTLSTTTPSHTQDFRHLWLAKRPCWLTHASVRE